MNPFDINKAGTNYVQSKPTFGALVTLSNIFSVIGWLIIVIAIIAAIAMIHELSIMAIFLGIGIAFVGLLSLAFGELIKLFLQIEENTRKKSI